MASVSASRWSTVRSRRAWSLGLFLAYVLACVTLIPVPSLFAQEPKKGAAAEAPKPEPPVEAPKADPAADAPKADAAPAPAADGTGTTKRSLLRWAIDASGPIGFFLLCLSVYFTALVVKLFMELRVSEAVPVALVEKLENAIKDRKFQEAYDACRDNDSFLARLVRTGVANLPNGRAEAKEAMNITQDEVVTTMEAKISYLAIIGTLGPMIGLVGTIAGMIASFQEIANAVDAQPKPAKVAEGISTALFITLEGVSLSVPAIFFFAFFRNRIAQMAMESAKVADRTITALLSAAKQNKG
jgi:biopolymer transport protein ExbB